MPGTIDNAGIRADLAAIATNAYPPLQLLKLPFNWFSPSTNGILQTGSANNGGASLSLTLSGVKSGSGILVFIDYDSRGVSPAPTNGCTDTEGNIYAEVQPGYLGFLEHAGADSFFTNNVSGGTFTITATSSAGTIFGMLAIEIGGVIGVQSSGAGGSTAAASGTPGNLAISYSASDGGGTPGSWTNSVGWALVFQDFFAQQCVQQIVPPLGVSSNTSAYSDGDPPTAVITIIFDMSGGGTPTAAPITSIPLNGPCNFIALVSEAIDEQGQYQQSALLGQQAAAGWIRFNGQGNVWIPFSFVSPLIPGYVTTSDNYGNNPILGGGFQAIEAPFHQLDWQPNQPILFSTPQPPTTPQGVLLAFAGLNLGIGAGIGAGSSSTYAIPSAAGPIARMKDACLL